MTHSPTLPKETEIIQRIDRFPKWGLSITSMITLGLGMLFIQYDIFNINVSFVQTCLQIVDGCTGNTSDQFIGLPVFVSLLGYGVGALTLGPLSDRFGRHKLLIVAMLITGLGSLYSALSMDYTNFVISRLITGIGVGADLAIINVYISEVAPRRKRARYTSVMFIMASLGSALGIWLGLFLTTPMAPWPQGLPVALASESFNTGWRWVYAIGAILALISIFLRVALPESPRWLIDNNLQDKARAVIDDMEQRATKQHPLLPVEVVVAPDTSVTSSGRRAMTELFTSPLYLRRLIVLSAAWTLGYLTIYAFSGALTTVLVRQGYTVGEAGIVSAIGLFGFIAAAVVARLVVERLERRNWMIIGAAISVVGALLVATGDGTPALVLLGALVLFFGQNIWVPAQYALTAESFPTRFRTTAYALADSIGHAGGGLGVFLLVGLLAPLPMTASMLGLVSFLVLGALVNLMAPKTRNKTLEEISQ
ncbi:MFS transporter [Yaniella flava]|uniref:MFS transporter n=1 Tax=Yaniella flava TaxID=287930 RepID=A0ABN2UZY3_9MICC